MMLCSALKILIIIFNHKIVYMDCKKKRRTFTAQNIRQIQLYAS